MRKIINCCDTTLFKLYARAAESLSYRKRISKYIASDLMSHCLSVEVHGGNLTISVNTPAAATLFSYELPELRSKLRTEEKMYGLCSIKCQVVKQPTPRDS